MPFSAVNVQQILRLLDSIVTTALALSCRSPRGAAFNPRRVKLNVVVAAQAMPPVPRTAASISTVANLL
jgi:hypothetical protein